MRERARRRQLSVTPLLGPALAAAVLALSFGAQSASAVDFGYPLTDLELLGKNFFFDKQLSTPRGKQSCASCHEPKVGWVLPLSDVNETTVGAPGAKPHEQGRRKVQTNAYASFSPEFRPGVGPRGLEGGNFWDGRAEGCGKFGLPDCQLGDGKVSETITPEDLPFGSPHVQFLGATSDQALNPTSRPGFEQNTREKTVCQMVKTAKYKDLYEKAWGEPIDCKKQGDPPAYHISFKRLAVAVAAWQASDDVNSFSSRRDLCIRKEKDPTNDKTDADGEFPCDNLSDEANLGHDIFYGVNTTGNNRIVFGPRPFAPATGPKWAFCSFCHNGVPEGDDPDPTLGNAPRELYTDFFFHCLGTPFNRDIPTTGFRVDEGLAEHTLNRGGPNDLGDQGCFKTPTVRNAAKDEIGITKDFFHNGYFKSLKQVVHFYNTSHSKPDCATLGIDDATADEAIVADCWPNNNGTGDGEFPTQAAPLVGNLGLFPEEEDALVAYMEALTDMHTPEPPGTSKKK